MVPRNRPGFNHRSVLVLGIIQLICGCISIFFGIIQASINSQLGFFGYGIWTGVFFVVAGILGITSSKNKKTSNIIAFMVMSIIASVFGVVLFGFSVASLSYDISRYSRSWNYYAWAVPLEILLVLTCVLELVVSIVSACYCCKAVCCGARHVTRQMVSGQVVQYVQGQDGQQFIIVNTPHQVPGPQPVVYNQQYPGNVTGYPPVAQNVSSPSHPMYPAMQHAQGQTYVSSQSYDAGGVQTPVYTPESGSKDKLEPPPYSK